MSPDVEVARSQRFAAFFGTLILSTVLYVALWWLLCFLGLHLLLHKEAQYPSLVYQAWYDGTFAVPYLPALVLGLRAYRWSPVVLIGALSGCVLGTILQVNVSRLY